MTNEEILQKMEIDMQLRGFSPLTIEGYSNKTKVYMKHFDKSADLLGENEIRIFLSYLDRERHLSPSSVNGHNSVLRFLYEVTLERDLSYKRLPRQKDPIKVPIAFSREEITALFSVIDSLKYRAIFSLAYGSGLRLSEIQHLKYQDIDGKTLRVFVSQGKGKKDRFVPLAQTTLYDLRKYYLACKPNHPDGWLFTNESPRNKIATSFISQAAIQNAFTKYHRLAGIKTHGSTHTLRNSYATHLMEDGVNVFFIQRLLGHATLWTTMRYLKIAVTDLMKTTSPLDTLNGVRHD